MYPCGGGCWAEGGCPAGDIAGGLPVRLKKNERNQRVALEVKGGRFCFVYGLGWRDLMMEERGFYCGVATAPHG